MPFNAFISSSYLFPSFQWWPFYFSLCCFSSSVSLSSRALSTIHTWWFLSLLLSPAWSSLLNIDPYFLIGSWTSLLDVSSAQQMQCAKIESNITLFASLPSPSQLTVLPSTVRPNLGISVSFFDSSLLLTSMFRQHDVLLTNSTSQIFPTFIPTVTGLILEKCPHWNISSTIKIHWINGYCNWSSCLSHLHYIYPLPYHQSSF